MKSQTLLSLVFTSLLLSLSLQGCNNAVVDNPPAKISKPATVMCTKEAKRCPDGSFVGRTGSKCEFAQCPNK